MSPDTVNQSESQAVSDVATPSPAVTPSSAPPSADVPKGRDRIVVLGRTQSGKTIYLAALYCRLWKTPEDIAIKAVDGRTHKSCVEIYETLRSGRWPSSTIGSRYLDFEITWQKEARPLVSLDYPGEVFRKAFIENTASPDVEELLDHVDRAAGVIVLLDPAVMVNKDMRVSMDDDFGMLKALERIRMWPGGDRVPVSIVLTKYDKRAPMIKADGGPSEFMRKRYRSLVAANREARVFVCSAVQQKDSPQGPVVDPKFHPTGVVAPLRHVLSSLQEQDRDREGRRVAEVYKENYHKLVREEQTRRHRAVWLWTGGVIGALIILAIVGWISLKLGSL